ncbi:MAG: hypothetical protein WCR04_05110, partial [Fibrobacteraceae bacterium]
TESMYASRYPCGSVIQPSKLGCATLTLHGFDALRHRLHFGHTQASLSLLRSICMLFTSPKQFLEVP